jgi:hypothetical protein
MGAGKKMKTRDEAVLARGAFDTRAYKAFIKKGRLHMLEGMDSACV